MVWARELVHGTLSTAGGPSLKPLPVLVAAPFTVVGDAAPLVWMALGRVSALVALLLAWRIGARLAGPVAGWAAAAVLAVAPDLARTAIYGSSEPLLLVFVLGAVERHLAGRDRHAFVLLALAGLIRPEVWPIVFVLAVAQRVVEGRFDRVALGAVAAAPVIWLGLAWIGSGNPFTQVVDHFSGPAKCTRCAVHVLPEAQQPHGAHVADGLTALSGATGSIVIPALVFGAVAIIVAARRGRRDVLLLGAVAIAWVLIVAAMAQFGYPGSRRYFIAPAALITVLAGVGVAALLERLPATRVRAGVAVALAALLGVTAFIPARESARLVGTAHVLDRDMAQLRSAVTLAGGRGAVLAAGRPAVNPYKQSALAWHLDTPLAGVQGTWHSTRTTPHWHPPAIVFRGPSRRAGPAPVLPPRFAARVLGRAGVWEVLRAGG